MQRPDRGACAGEDTRAHHLRQRRDDPDVLQHRVHLRIQGREVAFHGPTSFPGRQRPRARILEPRVGMDEAQVAHAITHHWLLRTAFVIPNARAINFPLLAAPNFVDVRPLDPTALHVVPPPADEQITLRQSACDDQKLGIGTIKLFT
jgi:hypothetical protein